MTNLTFDLDDLDLSKNETLKLISGAALHLPSKFGEDRPKDLGGTNKKNNINLTFDPIGPINLNQGSTRVHSPTFMQIRPRTVVLQKFDL